jgi:hypothetical protein
MTTTIRTTPASRTSTAIRPIAPAA